MQAGQQRIYAIGDVHGRADLLELLLSAIASDAYNAGVEPTIIFLGDIIDRGPDSLRALQLVAETLQRYPQSKLILGNHDNCLLEILGDNYRYRDVAKWMMVYGGLATVASLLPGFSGDEYDVGDELVAHHSIFLDMLQQAHRKIVIGEYCFVHAGVRPGVCLAEQTDYDLMWIREEFLRHAGPYEKIIVHGHTPTESGMPEFFFNRIAVDTGAYDTGVLAAVIIAGSLTGHITCSLEGIATKPLSVYLG